MVQTKTGGRGVCSQDGGLLISYLMADIALVILLMQIQLDLKARLTPASRDNDEEALLTFIEDQFVFDQVQKTDHTNQREEELAEDEFIAKVFLNSIIVGKTIQYTFLHRSFSVLFFHLRLPNKSSNFLLGISISSRVFSGLEIKESTFWKKNMMTENTLLFNLLLW